MTPDETLLLTIFREIKAKGHGEINIVIRDGVVVKLEKLEKVNLEMARLRD